MLDTLLVTSSFCKGPNSKYFWLVGHLVFCNYLAPSCSTKAATDNTETNECSYVPIKLYFWTLKFDFHVLFTSHERFFFSPFSTIYQCKNQVPAGLGSPLSSTANSLIF